MSMEDSAFHQTFGGPSSRRDLKKACFWYSKPPKKNAAEQVQCPTVLDNKLF